MLNIFLELNLLYLLSGHDESESKVLRTCLIFQTRNAKLSDLRKLLLRLDRLIVESIRIPRIPIFQDCTFKLKAIE